MDKWYEQAKRLLWPHLLVPLAVMVGLDYLTAFAVLLQVAAGAYMALQTFAVGVGLWAAMMVHFKSDSPWADVRRYNISRVFPLIGIGYEAFGWLIAEREDK